jgi:hypothetical protein
MSHSSASSGRHRLALDLTGRAVYIGAVSLVAWGVLAFGSPYPWAYVPLAAGSAMVGAIGWFATRPPSPVAIDQRRVLIALGALMLAGALQLIPLPARIVDAVSPANAAILGRIDLVFASLKAAIEGGAAATLPSRPLSIDPDATRRGLLLFVCFALLLAGLIRHCNTFGARRFGVWFVGFGAFVALIGIVQKALLGDQTWDGMKVYGFWEPQFRLSQPFGPFINRNHFAGWMLMALPMALGYLLSQLETGLKNVRPGWRYRLLWLSSPEGGRLQLAALSVVMMGVSLVMTLSRSGIACFGMAMAMASLAAARRQRSTGARLAVVLAIGVLVAAPVLWASSNVGERFSTQAASMNLRRIIWADTLRIVHDFPAVGTGLNTYAAAMQVYQTGFSKQNVREAHNDYLQLAAEGGLLFGVPVALTLLLCVSSIRTRFASDQDDPSTTWIRFGAAIGLAAIGLQSLVEFSLQKPGNAVTFVVLAAVALHKRRGRDSSDAVEAVRVKARDRSGAFVSISQ